MDYFQQFSGVTPGSTFRYLLAELGGFVFENWDLEINPGWLHADKASHLLLYYLSLASIFSNF